MGSFGKPRRVIGNVRKLKLGKGTIRGSSNFVMCLEMICNFWERLKVCEPSYRKRSYYCLSWIDNNGVSPKEGRPGGYTVGRQFVSIVPFAAQNDLELPRADKAFARQVHLDMGLN